MVTWETLALAAVVVALVLAGIAGAACWWGCTQQRKARRWRARSDGQAIANARLTAELEASLAWLTEDINANVGDGR